VRLTEPITIGSRKAPAAVVFGPHETNLAWGRAISDRQAAYYGRRAAGGAGVIVTEAASVTADDWPYERAPLAAECGPGWAAVAAACRPFGTVVLGGLAHAGGQGSSAYSQSVMWAPSRVADVVSREPPAELDQAGIVSLVGAFAAAARLAVDSGLDGVEIDSGAWSLLRQFQSGLTNQRGDAYGQDKLLMTRQVLAAVRTAIGPDRVLGLRLSCDELAPWAGITPAQAAEAVNELAGAEGRLLDLLTVVRAGPYSTASYRPDSHAEPAFNRELTRAMREAAAGRVPVVLQGSVVDPDDAEAALQAGIADLVEMTRAQIADARLVGLLRLGQAERVRPCLLCNQACQVRDPRNPIVSCVADPRSGYETAEPDVDALALAAAPVPAPAGPPVLVVGAGPAGPPVLVVGAGPAGLECGRVLAAGGRRVRIVERASRPGGAVAAVAAGAAAGGSRSRSRLGRLLDWQVAECARHGVELVLDHTADEAGLETARAEGWVVVVATGSRPVTDRYAGRGSPAVVDALTLYTAGVDRWPDGPVVVDDPVGDAIGVGVAEWLAGTGRLVTLVCPDPVAGTLLARTGDLAPANVRLQQAGVDRRLRSRITAVGDGQVTVEDVWTGAGETLDAALVVDCGHRLPDDALWQALADRTVRRAGDCVAPRTVLEAVLEGRRVALALLGQGQVSGGGTGAAAGLGAHR
jgi:2,4-dienoyl-CoA reductase (NADPH2)